MNILNIFTGNIFKKDKSSAQLAKDRLRIIVESRSSNTQDDAGIEKLKKLILKLIADHMKVEKKDITINIEEKNKNSVMELSVKLPNEQPLEIS